MSAARSRQSFRRKLVLLVVFSSGVSAMLVGTALIWAFYNTMHDVAVSQLHTEADLVSMHSAATLPFDNPKEATETLSALAAIPTVVGAWIYRPTGEPFAEFDRAGLDYGPSAEVDRFEDERLILSRPIRYEGDQVGVLVIAYDLAPLRQRLRVMIVTGVLLTLLATTLAVALSVRLQRRLAAPLAELSATARNVSVTGDYSLRAKRFSDDEFGDLTETFNQMLRTIQAQNAEITETNEELRQKNTEMEQFTYTVSHDLKNPIVTIQGFVGMIKEDIAAGNPEEMLDSVNHIARAAGRMTQLINELLELSRIGRVRHEPEKVDVQALVAALADELSEQLAGRGAKIEVAEPLPQVMADPVRLRQALENLVVNAIKYGCTQENRTITIGGQANHTEVRYYVRDRGQGVEAQYHQKIFGLFQRLDNTAEGTGVGLAIVSRIAETHGGRAWVESTPGQGATFWIAFPHGTDRTQT